MPRFARWMNALSLDAVLVAVLWQVVFCTSFSDRLPSVSESIALALTVWLIYCADRLLDANRMNVRRPSSFRHRFHHRHRRILSAAWGLLLILDTVIVSTRIDLKTQSAGMLVAVAVLLYGAAVHLARMPMIRFTKELQVGVLFASGVGLVTWVEVLNAPDQLTDWLVTWCLASLLFACNCVFVAVCELPYDRAQGFDSLPGGMDRTDQMRTRLIATTLILAAVSAGGAAIQIIPNTAATALAASSLLLSAICTWLPTRVSLASSQLETLASETLASETLASETLASETLATPFGFLADAAIFLPPLFCVLLQ